MKELDKVRLTDRSVDKQAGKDNTVKHRVRRETHRQAGNEISGWWESEIGRSENWEGSSADWEPLYSSLG